MYRLQKSVLWDRMAVDASTIELTDDQIAQIKEGGYTAAICLHYGGNDWSTSQQKGLEDTFGELGIEIVAVTDANFSAETQVSNIETVMAKKPDILVSIPTDATATADAYKQAAAAGIKIVFMDQRANGLEAGKDYVSVVSADNYGNGYASGTVLGDALGGKGKVAMVYYDANFAPTNQRDEGFRDAMKNYPDIEIVTEQGFTDESGCAEQGDAILTQFPNIDGIYASWDVPMEGVLSAVRAAGMEGKVTLACNDLGNNVAREIASGNIAGGGAQMPYDQGVAEAKLAALALLGEETPSYVAVPAETVTHENVLEAYTDVYHVETPDWLKEAYVD
jgi:ribose transport system substrate-binding protein